MHLPKRGITKSDNQLLIKISNMKLADYMLHNRLDQGHFWTVFTTRVFRLQNNIPRRVYFAKTTDELHDVLNQLADNPNPPKLSPGQERQLLACGIWELMVKLPDAECAIIIDKTCQAIKEFVLVTHLDGDWGQTPLYSVRWDKSKKDFVSERMASQTLLNRLSSNYGRPGASEN
jgi:hypothetical protein